MPLADAIKFIKKASKDHELRNSLYSIPTEMIFIELARQGYEFNISEFKESVNMLHVKCQTEEQANLLFEVVCWFKMLCN